MKNNNLFIKSIIIILITFILCSCDNRTSIKTKSNSFSAPFTNYLLNETNIFQEEVKIINKDIDFPKKYDLRDKGLVTPVKSQNPWGSCWGFAAIAAAETSILNDFNTTYEDTALDLSELQLIWFSKSHIVDENDSQYGEGIYVSGDNNALSYGGLVYTATSVFSSGNGVIGENDLPYKGKNGNTSGSVYNYSPNDDWSVDEKYRYSQTFELVESNVLPNPVIRDGDDNYVGYNKYATDCIKEELLNGRAVSICYHADKYMPGDNGNPKYINTSNNNWTHYTYDDTSYNHAVTIVGYDDTISKESFLNHSNQTGFAHYPEGDGAWICKNSWGAETEKFPNYGSWGIKNDDGLSTGYFYLSYYDHSLYGPESFKFDISKEKKNYIIDQYDYLQSNEQECWYSQSPMKMANCFNADYDESIYALSCETAVENSDVSIEVYILKDGFSNPTDGEIVYSNTINCAYAGYHRIELDNPIIIEKNRRYAIVVSEVFNQDNNKYYGVFVDRQNSKDCAVQVSSSLDEKDSSGLIYGVGIVNKGESYLYIDNLNGWCDWSNIIEDFSNTCLSNDTFDNFPIKAYCDFTSN